jgi:hypothetical protein
VCYICQIAPIRTLIVAQALLFIQPNVCNEISKRRIIDSMAEREIVIKREVTKKH